MTDPIVIGIGTNKWVKDSVTKMMTLIHPSTGGILSLHDDTGVDYQVPVGKKFIILAQYASGGGNAYYSSAQSVKQHQANLYKNTTTDTITGAIKVLTNSSVTSYYSADSQAAKTMNPKVECYIEIPAGYFIIGDITNTGYGGITVTGVETDV